MKREIVEEFAAKVTAAMTHFIREVYYADEFAPRVRLDFSPRRRVSWGGVRGDENAPFVSLALARYVDGGEIAHVEYEHFEDDAEIGTLDSVSWKTSCAAMIAHEITHAFLYSDEGSLARVKHEEEARDLTAHGKLFQIVYRAMRANFVNNRAYDLIPLESEREQKQSIARGWYCKVLLMNNMRYCYYYATDDDALLGVLYEGEDGGVYEVADDGGSVELPCATMREAVQMLMEGR